MTNLRILSLSDVQGNLNSFNDLYHRNKNSINLIIHTGNFGFWDNDTISSDNDNTFLKQIVAFSEVLDQDLVNEINNLSTITNSNNTDYNNHLKEKLQGTNLSQLDDYLLGKEKLLCPVYTIFGPLDDPRVINKFQTGEYKIQNLFLIDHTKCYDIASPLADQPNIRLYGIGGTLKIHSLFDHGKLDPDLEKNLCGKIGDLWISMIQIATMYQNVMNNNESSSGSETINIFVSHSPIIKTPLLEHIAIMTNSDFSISQGLHFRYPVMGNGMSFVDSMGGSAGYIESYRSKFSRLRMILGELWVIVKENLNDLLEDNSEENIEFKRLLEIGLSLFDKIPVSINDSTEKIIPLSLNNDSEIDESEVNKKVLKKINDMYFSAYYNLWHFNLCDLITRQPNSTRQSDFNIMIFDLDEFGDFKLEHCASQGFNFRFKIRSTEENGAKEEGEEEQEDIDEEEEEDEDDEEEEEGEEEGDDDEGEDEEADEEEVEEEVEGGGEGKGEGDIEEEDSEENDDEEEDGKEEDYDDGDKGKYKGNKFIPNYRGRGRGRGSRGRGRGRGRGGYRGKPRGRGRGG